MPAGDALSLKREKRRHILHCCHPFIFRSSILREKGENEAEIGMSDSIHLIEHSYWSATASESDIQSFWWVMLMVFKCCYRWLWLRFASIDVREKEQSLRRKKHMKVDSTRPVSRSSASTSLCRPYTFKDILFSRHLLLSYIALIFTYGTYAEGAKNTELSMKSTYFSFLFYCSFSCRMSFTNGAHLHIYFFSFSARPTLEEADAVFSEHHISILDIVIGRVW